jgi:hypothetical protein
MTFGKALRKTKHDTSVAAALPEWPKPRRLWYQRGPIPDIAVGVGSAVLTLSEAMGRQLDAEAFLRSDWMLRMR